MDLVLFRHAWLFLLGIGVLNALALWFNIQHVLPWRAGKRDGYYAVLWRFTWTLCSGPLLMGLGVVLQLVPSTAEYVFPTTEYPWTFVPWLCAMALVVLLPVWTCWLGGAEMLFHYREILPHMRITSTTMLKGQVIAASLGVAIPLVYAVFLEVRARGDKAFSLPRKDCPTMWVRVKAPTSALPVLQQRRGRD